MASTRWGKKRHIHKCEYHSIANKSLNRHADLRLESSCGFRITCLEVLGNKSLRSSLWASQQLWSVHRAPAEQGRAPESSKIPRVSVLVAQFQLKDSSFFQGRKGAAGHEESFPDFLLRLPIRRSVGSNTNGPKPPVYITSSIINPDDKWSWVCTSPGWYSAKHSQIA